MDSLESYEYLPGRMLIQGDKFRTSGGPYYQCRSGQKARMGERPGKYEFVRMERDERGTETIIAKRMNGESARLIVKHGEGRQKIADEWIDRPYKISKVRKPR
jgi:hypothetical protein